ncbi:MAG: hypothetical protein SF053_20575 [Bacteroidia bacterium]|nr:hypothetical protein [Bacteroidia bacterium]
MIMKTPILLITALLVLLLSGCDFDIFPDPEPPPPPVLPPITQTGENTLGFLLDGEVWVPNRIFQAQYRKSDGAFNLGCRRDSFNLGGQHAGETFLIQFKDGGQAHLNYLITHQAEGIFFLLNLGANMKHSTPGV